MKFARWIFGIAGVYGVISVGPLYFMEQSISRQDPPPITHPMFFYGFVGVTLAWQLFFFAIAREPARLRPAMPFAVLEKLSFGIGAMVLYRQGRLDHGDLYFGGIDLVLAVLFTLCWLKLPSGERLS
jgi:drug/metabolite transporter (DMT)-like permease